MAGPASRRAAVQQRLRAGFLAGLPARLLELAELLADGDGREPALHDLARLSETAESLELDALVSSVAKGVERIEAGAAAGPGLAPIVRAVGEVGGPTPIAPIAVVGDARTVASVLAQDDGCCEPIVAVESVGALTRALVAIWPQAILLPAGLAHEVGALTSHFGSPVWLYGPSRDAAGRLAAVRSRAQGYFAEPLALPELLSQIRYHAARSDAAPLVALGGDPEWAGPAGEALRAAGYEVHAVRDPLALPAVLHGMYPEAVVVGPAGASVQAEAVQLVRQHLGRGYIALLVVGHPSLYVGGADDVLRESDDLVSRVASRLARLADYRRDRDDLTHIPNRAGVLESLQRLAAWSERANQPLTVALVLAEGLSDAAARHGREAGNACRRHLAAALERGLRRVDLVGTLGGDVFLAALVRCGPRETQRRMDEIKAAFESRVHADRRLREVVLSVGIADTRAGTVGLMKRAQAALDKVRATRA